QAAVGREVEVAGPVVAGNSLGRRQEEEAVHAVLVPALGETEKRVALAVEPERVAVDHVEGSGGQERQRLRDAAAGLEQLGLVREDDVRTVARGEMVLDQ